MVLNIMDMLRISTCRSPAQTSFLHYRLILLLRQMTSAFEALISISIKQVKNPFWFLLPVVFISGNFTTTHSSDQKYMSHPGFLSFSPYIQSISKTCQFHIQNISPIRSLLPRSTTTHSNPRYHHLLPGLIPSRVSQLVFLFLLLPHIIYSPHSNHSDLLKI